MDVARARGNLEPKSQGASCREKNVAGPNMPKLLQALDSAFLEILKKFLFWQNPWVHTYKFCSCHFFSIATIGVRKLRNVFFRFFKKPANLPSFLKNFTNNLPK